MQPATSKTPTQDSSVSHLCHPPRQRNQALTPPQTPASQRGTTTLCPISMSKIKKISAHWLPHQNLNVKESAKQEPQEMGWGATTLSMKIAPLTTSRH